MRSHFPDYRRYFFQIATMRSPAGFGHTRNRCGWELHPAQNRGESEPDEFDRQFGGRVNEPGPISFLSRTDNRFRHVSFSLAFSKPNTAKLFTNKRPPK